MLSVATSLTGCARRMQTRSSYCRTGSSACYLQLLPSQTRSKDRIARGVGCNYFAMRHTEAKDTQTNKQTYVWLFVPLPPNNALLCNRPNTLS